MYLKKKHHTDKLSIYHIWLNWQPVQITSVPASRIKYSESPIFTSFSQDQQNSEVSSLAYNAICIRLAILA